MIKLAIDGQRMQGTYIVDCICGTSWRGTAEKLDSIGYSPTLPIAESVVHAKLEHPELTLDLRFSESFLTWLMDYWEWFNFRVAMAVTQRSTTFGPTIG